MKRLTASMWPVLVFGARSKKKPKSKKKEAIDLVKSKYGVDVNEDIAEAILLSEFDKFE